MTVDNNLGLGLVASGQAGKETVINDALLRLGEAASSTIHYDLTAADAHPTLDQLQRNSLHILDNVATARQFVLPVAKRWAYLASPAANTANVSIVMGTTIFTVQPGFSVFFATDGTANGLVVYNLGGEAGLPDVPDDGLYFRSFGEWVEFDPVTAGIPDVPDATLSLRRYGEWVAYTAPAAAVPLIIKDEGTNVETSASALNFVGAGVTVTDSGGVAVVNIPAAPSGGTNIVIKDEGATVEATATALNFTGAGVTVTDSGGVAVVNIPGATGGGGTSGSTVSYGGVYGAAVGNATLTFDDSPALPADWTYSATNDVQFFADADAASGTTNTLTFRDVLNNQTCYINIPIVADATHNTATIRFKTSSEGASDWFRIYLDGVQQVQYAGTTAPDWQTYTINGIAAGAHTLKLQYSKDGSVDAGIDNVRFSKLIYPKIVPATISAGTVVTYGGHRWIALTTNPADVPSISSANWALFALGSAVLDAPSTTPGSRTTAAGCQGTLVNVGCDCTIEALYFKHETTTNGQYQASIVVLDGSYKVTSILGQSRIKTATVGQSDSTLQEYIFDAPVKIPNGTRCGIVVTRLVADGTTGWYVMSCNGGFINQMGFASLGFFLSQAKNTLSVNDIFSAGATNAAWFGVLAQPQMRA